MGKDLSEYWLGIVPADEANSFLRDVLNIWLKEADVQELISMLTFLNKCEGSALYRFGEYPSCEDALARKNLSWLYPYPMKMFSIQDIESLAENTEFEPYFSWSDEYIIPCTASGKIGSLGKDGELFLRESFSADLSRFYSDSIWFNPFMLNKFPEGYRYLLSSALEAA